MIFDNSLSDFFLNFGSLGIVAFVVWRQTTRTDKLIMNNTIALTKVYEVMKR